MFKEAILDIGINILLQAVFTDPHGVGIKNLCALVQHLFLVYTYVSLFKKEISP
jgi:hypothetical protein